MTLKFVLLAPKISRRSTMTKALIARLSHRLFMFGPFISISAPGLIEDKHHDE